MGFLWLLNTDFIIISRILKSNRLLFVSAKILSRAGRTLHEVQTHLDKEGASDLVVELVIKSGNSPSIFSEAVELGIALLEGGNPNIQKSMFNKLVGGDVSQSFFKVCEQTLKIINYTIPNISILRVVVWQYYSVIYFFSLLSVENSRTGLLKMGCKGWQGTRSRIGTIAN